MKGKVWRSLFAGMFIAMMPTFATAQKIETGFLNRSITVSGNEYRYVVYVPREFDRKKMWPVIVALHGGGEYGNDGLRHTNGVNYPSPAPAGSRDVFEYLAKRVSRLPVWIFHGDADESISVEESRKMNAALKAAKADVQYTEFPGVGHNAWDPAYARADLIEWMLKQRQR